MKVENVSINTRRNKKLSIKEIIKSKIKIKISTIIKLIVGCIFGFFGLIFIVGGFKIGIDAWNILFDDFSECLWLSLKGVGITFIGVAIIAIPLLVVEFFFSDPLS